MMKKIISVLLFLMLASGAMAVSVSNTPILFENPESPPLFNVQYTVGTDVLFTETYTRNSGETAQSFRDEIYALCEWAGSDPGETWKISGAKYDSNSQLEQLTCTIYGGQNPTTEEPSPLINPPEEVPNTDYDSYGSIGESCNTYADCGSACDRFGSGYSPRCIDGGYGKICFCGEDIAIYSPPCARDTDCPNGETCIAGGVCTIVGQAYEDSGNPNPLTAEDIERITKENDKISITYCTDQTPVFLCADTSPMYCDKDNNLVQNAIICGCPAGEKIDPGFVQRCCKADGSDCSDKECSLGRSYTQECANGESVVVATCINDGTQNKIEKTGAFCKDKESSNNWIYYLLGASVIVILLVLLSFSLRKG